MAIRHIPPQETKRWTGPYLGNYYGTLWHTFNVDLDRGEGKIGLSRRMVRIEDTVEIGSNVINAFIRTNADCEDRYWALHFNGGLDKTDSSDSVVPSLDWDTDPLDSTPATKAYDFAVIGNDSRNDSGRNQLFVTTDCNIDVLNDTGNSVWTGDWWTVKHSQPALKADVYHPIEYFPFRKIGLVGDGNLVHTILRPSDTQNDTLTNSRLILPDQYVIRHIFTTSNRAWFLSRHRFRGEAIIVEWDGFTQSANNFHKAHATGVLCGVNYRDIPIVVNTAGQILEYNGNGFVPMVRNGQKVIFPFADDEGNGFNLGTDSSATWDIAPRGMTVGEDGLVYININVPRYVSYRQGAGIWCLNPETGRLYHKYSLGRYSDSGTQFDYGGQYLGNPGTLYPISPDVSQRTMLASGRVRTDGASAVQGGIWLLEGAGSSTANRGYFVSQFIQADEVREFWDTLWLRFKRFVTSSDTIIVKARGVRQMTDATGAAIQKTITWTSTTTFTVTLASGDDALAEGDEVEVIGGNNSGILAHITTISGAHGVLQTITIEASIDALGIGSGSAYARFDRWKKLGSITSLLIYEANLNIGIPSSFIQFKVELRGPFREMDVSDLIINSNPSIYIKK